MHKNGRTKYNKQGIRGGIVTTTPPYFDSTNLARLLADMNERGGFPIAVLTDRQGLPIAFAAGPDHDPETQSAVVAMIQKTASQVRHQLGMAQTDEISLFDKEGRRLVCRPFSANGYDLLLAVLVKDRNQTYRRLTNQAVSTIQRQWKL